MTYVITEPCIGTKDQSCVEVCPVEAIYPEDEVPDDQESYITKAANYFE